MSAFDLVSSIADVRLKPRLLRSLLKDRLPDKDHPFHNPSDLSYVVSLVKTHQLLSESSQQPINQKQIDDWKSAVDAWVERLLALLSSNMPDKCWAGICLLGVTCQECSSDRFLLSYSLWFNKLLSHVQPPADSHIVKVASCASITDLFTRLGGFPNAKKDGNSHASKLIQPVLKLLNDDISESVWGGAVQLLCTILKFFPSSISRHYDFIETAIASKIMRGKYCDNMLEKLAHCLALLPRSRGDEDSWSLIMRKILIMVNDYLNDSFQGLEEEEPGKEAVRLLISPWQDSPPPLGGHTLSRETSNEAVKRSERLLMSSVSSLMHCCSTMLTSSYPTKVTAPIRPLLALIERVLMVDGSLSHSRYSSFVTAMQQESICSELPVLHSSGLDLLFAIIKRLRSQLLPHAAYIVRLVTVYFKRCTVPKLRIKVYSIIKILLMSMGVGIAMYLAQDVINNLLVDLNPVDQESGITSSGALLKASEKLLQPSHRKRKHGTSAGSTDQQGTNLEFEAPKEHLMSPISVKIAALEALETLLTVGGLGSASWRSNVDLLLITIATNSSEEEWADREKSASSLNKSTLSWTAFRLAVLRALLASLLSPARVRPPYLAQSLELFRRGRQESGSELAEFCAHALLVLEVLIHPRAHPMMDFPSADCNFYEVANTNYQEYAYSGGQKHSTSLPSGMQGMGHDIPDSDDDDLYNRWVGNGDEMDSPLTDPDNKHTSLAEELPATLTIHPAENASVDGSSGTINAEKSEQGPSVAIADTRNSIRDKADEIMIESDQFQESTAQLSSKGVTTPAIFGGSKMGALHHSDSEMGHGENVLAAKGNVTKAINPFSAISNLQKSKGSDIELDHESFPDIVDEDPDSD